MPRPTHKDRAEEIRRRGDRCAVPGCYLPRFGLSVHCKTHTWKATKRGDPLGSPIKPQHLRPYRLRVLVALDEYGHEPSIAVGVDWAYRLLAHGQDYGVPGSPSEKARHWLFRMRQDEAHPREVLATILAMYVMREENPAAFPSDAHFKTQLVRRLVLDHIPAHLRRPPKRSAKSGQVYSGSTPFPRGAVRYLSDVIMRGLSKFAPRFARFVSELARVSEQRKQGDPFGLDPVFEFTVITPTTNEDQE